MQEVKIRAAKPSDIAFIYATWLRSYRSDNDFAASMRSSIYFAFYRTVIDQLLMDSKVSVAYLSDDPDIIFGYCVSNGEVLHYVYVKEAFRKLGIAHKLIGNVTSCTHKTHCVEKYLKNDSIQYNPLLLFRRQIEEN